MYFDKFFFFPLSLYLDFRLVPRLSLYLDHLENGFFFREKLLDPAIESHVRAVVAITTLLKNAPELGTGQVGKDGVLQMMLTMAQSDDKVQQIVAAEALIAASAKKKDTSMIVSQVCYSLTIHSLKACLSRDPFID